MSLIRVLSIVVLAATLALLAKSYFAKPDPLARNYDLCLDLDADRVVVLAACSAVYAAEWLPDHVRGQVLKFRAHAFKNEEDYDAAAQDLTQAILLRSWDGNALSMRASVWARLHDYGNTLRDLERLEQLEDLNVSNMRLRAWAYIKLDKIELAEAHYERAVRLDPENLDTFRWWNRRMSAVDRPELAIRACKRLIQETPEDEEHPCKPKVRKALEQYQKAIEFLTDSRTFTTDAPEDWPPVLRAAYSSLLGFSYFQLGVDKETILSAFEAWYDTGKDHPYPAIFLAATHFRFSEEDEGRRYVNAAAKALVEQDTSRPDHNWQELKQVLSPVQAEKAITLYFSAIAFSKARNYDMAEASFQKFMDMGGEPAKSILINVLVAGGFTPDVHTAMDNPIEFRRGRERFMVDHGRLLAADGAEFARMLK